MTAKLPRKPGPEAPREPRGGRVFVVRYVDHKGQTYSQLFFRRASAYALQDWVNRCGGHANVWATTAEWELQG